MLHSVFSAQLSVPTSTPDPLEAEPADGRRPLIDGDPEVFGLTRCCSKIPADGKRRIIPDPDEARVPGRSRWSTSSRDGATGTQPPETRPKCTWTRRRRRRRCCPTGNGSRHRRQLPETARKATSSCLTRPRRPSWSPRESNPVPAVVVVRTEQRHEDRRQSRRRRRPQRRLRR